MMVSRSQTPRSAGRPKIFIALLAVLLTLAPGAGAKPECDVKLAATLEVAGETYAPARELGSGLSGRVIQARAADGACVQIKTYRSWFKCRSDVRLYRRLKSEGFPVLDILAVDGWQKQVVFAYRRGLDLHNFTNVHALAVGHDLKEILIQHPQLAEILALDALKIDADYRALLARLRKYGYREFFYHAKNILVDLDTGQVVILDPT